MLHFRRYPRNFRYWYVYSNKSSLQTEIHGPPFTLSPFLSYFASTPCLWRGVWFQSVFDYAVISFPLVVQCSPPPPSMFITSGLHRAITLTSYFTLQPIRTADQTPPTALLSPGMMVISKWMKLIWSLGFLSFNFLRCLPELEKAASAETKITSDQMIAVVARCFHISF